MNDFDFSKIPLDTKIAGRIVDNYNETKISITNRGKIGSIFGSKDNVSYNVAALVCVLSVLSLLFLY